jgi:hypothetical protein
MKKGKKRKEEKSEIVLVARKRHFSKSYSIPFNLICQINPLDTSPLRYTTLCFLTTVESAYLDKFGTDTK